MLPSAPNSRLHPGRLLLLQAAFSSKTAREASEQRGRERKSKSPWRIGRGSAANTVNSRQGSAELLNSLYDCQGGCENSTCW